MRPGVYITFDVECSMGGAWVNENLRPVPPSRAVWGRYETREFGLKLICNILSRYALPATFFVEAFMAEQGNPGGEKNICRFLVDNGHDVQLHVHPNHWHYGLKRHGKAFPLTDYIAELSRDEQLFLVQEGADRIERWAGKRPIAFRAGNMGASEQTLGILPKAGIWIDSSYTFPYTGGQCRFLAGDPYNGSKWYGDVLEVALSGFQQTKLPGLHPSKPVDLMGSSFEECRDSIRMICDAGADAVAILHSFSLIKVRDVQYHGGKLNKVVTRRFERLCEWLCANRATYPTRTFFELGRMIREDGYEPKTVEPCTIQRPLRAVVRNAVQVLNNFYWF
ncbi:MAG: polysaccharide deacetylase family protein [Deltaproteobacteria bacterium]|nr:polysaccharide deacetylase family protein [Deltaproteobacteria bacterium]